MSRQLQRRLFVGVFGAIWGAGALWGIAAGASPVLAVPALVIGVVCLFAAVFP